MPDPITALPGVQRKTTAVHIIREKAGAYHMAMTTGGNPHTAFLLAVSYHMTHGTRATCCSFGDCGDKGTAVVDAGKNKKTTCSDLIPCG